MGGIPNAKGGGLIAALVELQQATAGELDFAHLARTRAVRTLQEVRPRRQRRKDQ